ncbi:MAG: fibronectin type III domain-containing protein [Candidatus Saliniplasma sp.]
MKLSLKSFISLLLILSILASLSVAVINTQGEEIRAVSSPRNLSGIIHRTHISLEWDAPGQETIDIEGYYIYRGLGSLPPERIGRVNRTSFTDHEIESGRTYTYYVTAFYGGENETAPSDRIQKTALGSNVPTETPNLSAYPGDSQVFLDWDEPVDNGGEEITRYNIYRGENVDDFEKVHETHNKHIFEDKNVTNGLEYNYVVTAVNDEGESEWSRIVSAKPLYNITEPSSPFDIYLFSGEEHMELYWSPPQDKGNSSLIEYRIYRKEEEEFVYLNSTKQDYYIDNEVELDVSYQYVITAVNGEGESDYSEEVEKSLVLGNNPQKLLDISADSKEGSVELNWNTDEDISRYLIFKGSEPEELSFYKMVGAIENFDDTEVEANTTYYYSVKVVDDEGRISQSSEIVEATPLEEKVEDDDPVDLSTYGIYGLIIGLIVVIAFLFVHKDKIKRRYIGKRHEWDSGEQQDEEIKDEEVVKVRPKKINEIGSIDQEDKSFENGQIEVNKREDFIDD